MAHDHDASEDAATQEPADESPQAGMAPLNYSDLPGLEHVCLEDSFVREVAQDGGTLTFVLVAALRKAHPFYSGPRSNERHCFRPATLVFREAQVKWRSRTNVRFTDADGAVDVGNIDILVAPPEGGYHIEGDFGVVDIVRSRAPVFTVVGETPGVRAYRRNVFRRWVRTGDAIAPGEHEHGHGHDHPEPSAPAARDQAHHDHAHHDHAHPHPHAHSHEK